MAFLSQASPFLWKTGGVVVARLHLAPEASQVKLERKRKRPNCCLSFCAGGWGSLVYCVLGQGTVPLLFIRQGY